MAQDTLPKGPTMNADYRMELIPDHPQGLDGCRVRVYHKGVLVLDRHAMSEAGARTLYLQWVNKQAKV